MERNTYHNRPNCFVSSTYIQTMMMIIVKDNSRYPIKRQRNHDITNKSIANEILHTLQMWKFD